MKQKAWPTESLGHMAKFLSGGTPTKSEDRFWGGEIPWISSAEMAEERIYETAHNVTTDGAQNGTRLVPKDTVLVVVRGMSLAKECRVSLTTKESTFNQDIKALKLSSDVDPRFMFYYLRSQKLALRDAASEAAHGTKKLDMPVLEQWPFPVVPIHIQRKIAAILTAYDDLIEINKRRIALLEKMAEELYREWFVRMRFPGHQNTKFVRGVPEGWEIKPLQSFCKEIRAGVKKKDLANEEIYIGLEHIPRKSIAITQWSTADTVDSDKLRFKERDILFSKIRPYLHKVALAHFSGACSSDTIVVRPDNRIYEGFLLFTVFSETFVELATIAAKGTKMPRADWTFLEQLKLKVPPIELLEIYQSMFEENFSLIATLLEANRQATKTRDLLLPRLISGKLSVENLNIQFPPSMREARQKESTEADSALA